MSDQTLLQIRALPAFLALEDGEIHTALKKGQPCAICEETGRLTMAYIATFAARPSREGPSVEEGGRPIERIAMQLAASLFNDRELLAAVSSLVVQARPDCAHE